MKNIFIAALTLAVAGLGQEAPAAAVASEAVKDAPFAADVTIERVQTLFDGNRIRHATSGRMYRDAAGRTRLETSSGLTIGNPDGGGWELDAERKVAHILTPPRAGESISPRLVRHTEQLGTQVVEGYSCDGSRISTTIPAGARGNDMEIEIVSERWFSPELQEIVLRTQHDPRSGDSTYKLTNIQRGDPPASLFEVPADYKLVELPPPVIVETR